MKIILINYDNEKYFTQSENFKQEYSATIAKVGELKEIKEKALICRFFL